VARKGILPGGEGWVSQPREPGSRAGRTKKLIGNPPDARLDGCGQPVRALREVCLNASALSDFHSLSVSVSFCSGDGRLSDSGVSVPQSNLFSPNGRLSPEIISSEFCDPSVTVFHFCLIINFPRS